VFVYLKGSGDLIRSRMQHRASHFMKATMLDSQFETLEEPAPSDAIIVEISEQPDRIVERILSALRDSGDAATSASSQDHGET
jgi:gluconokinase